MLLLIWQKRGNMRNKDVAGYINLFVGVFLFFGLNYQTAGLFFQGLALGCFLGSVADQIKEKKNKK